MKATGIVRRIDDLGRIVIPKEVRRQIFGTQDASGEPMEFFMEGDSIVLKKYIFEQESMEEEKEIRVGDIIIPDLLKGQEAVVCFVERTSKGNAYHYFNGTTFGWAIDSRCKKTGKHVDLSSILAELKKE